MGNRKSSLVRHHSNNCCIEDPSIDAKIKEWEFEGKKYLFLKIRICIHWKYFSRYLWILKGDTVSL